MGYDCLWCVFITYQCFFLACGSWKVSSWRPNNEIPTGLCIDLHWRSLFSHIWFAFSSEMVSHQIVYIYYLNFVISGNSSLLTFIANKNPSKNRMQPTPMTSDFGTGCNPPCVGSAYIWSMEIPLTDYSGRCLHIYIYIYIYIYTCI